ncbi:phage integrase central domain-containing protein [Glaciimonas immobilis]|uniref:Phage integrase central domain-containing protein n=1 Tax=Glaciimonas immobilis TaxID=728004 RepID=A0A840RZ68_9BURK|nr:hypothetical protein [Glaciimonas immobilis]KAF3996072.1 hypothetical protein HAV38_20205 [Glaciimonas immobilis]MBB5201791.1 hypothetical protein [Glaciimonas immobilis]
MLDALRQIEKRGALEMAERQGQVYDKTFRYAIAIGVADNDSLHSLRGALKQTMNGTMPRLRRRSYRSLFVF